MELLWTWWHWLLGRELTKAGLHLASLRLNLGATHSASQLINSLWAYWTVHWTCGSPQLGLNVNTSKASGPVCDPLSCIMGPYKRRRPSESWFSRGLVIAAHSKAHSQAYLHKQPFWAKTEQRPKPSRPFLLGSQCLNNTQETAAK